jgi:hypothetical protein
MTGFVDAIHYFKTNKQGSLPIMANYLQQTDMTAVGSSYDAVSAIYRRSPTAPLAGAQAAIDYLASGTTPAAKSLDPAKFIDNSILDGLQSSGFIDNLYK